MNDFWDRLTAAARGAQMMMALSALNPVEARMAQHARLGDEQAQEELERALLRRGVLPYPIGAAEFSQKSHELADFLEASRTDWRWTTPEEAVSRWGSPGYPRYELASWGAEHLGSAAFWTLCTYEDRLCLVLYTVAGPSKQLWWSVIDRGGTRFEADVRPAMAWIRDSADEEQRIERILAAWQDSDTKDRYSTLAYEWLVEDAQSVDDLHDRLQMIESAFDMLSPAHGSEYSIGDVINLSAMPLPTWGDKPVFPGPDDEIWSWDEQEVLYGESPEDVERLYREEFVKRMEEIYTELQTEG